MDTEQIADKKLNHEEERIIAVRFGCSTDYVKKISNGQRKANTQRAKSIKKAIEIVKENKIKITNEINNIEIDQD